MRKKLSLLYPHSLSLAWHLSGSTPTVCIPFTDELFGASACVSNKHKTNANLIYSGLQSRGKILKYYTAWKTDIKIPGVLIEGEALVF